METNNVSRVEYSLNDQCWYMKQMNPGQGVAEGIHLLPGERDLAFTGWNYAKVPGDVYSDLQMAGEIDDPYVGRNLVRLKWVQYMEWWYICRFNVPRGFDKKDLELQFEGVTYSCEVWLNGTYLGKHEGMNSSFGFNISRYINTDMDDTIINECENMLCVKLDPAPQSLYNIAGKHHTFSGDYLPGFVPVGIWRPVKIIATDNVRIDATRIESTIHEDGSATVNIQSDIEVLKGSNAPYKMTTEIWNNDGDSFVQEQDVFMAPGTNEMFSKLTIPDAKIWWPWDMGDQPLYFATVTITKDGIEVDRVTTRFGIREIKMEMNPGFTKDEAEYPWTFVINGKVEFLRSGCWGGPPSFLYGRNSKERYEHFITLAKECNLNNLRMFGWHPPEVTEFYDLCDELGITVWTNFPLASQVLRDDPEYVNSVLFESAEIVKNRRNHPSNIFWMGGEEVYFSQGQVNSHNKRMMIQVGRHIANYTNVPYAHASMMSSAPAIQMGYKSRECIHANGAYYAAGSRFIEDYFKLVDACIVPELAAASAPCVESLKKFVPEQDLWPLGPTWGYLQANVDILKAVNYEIFGDIKFGSLEEFAEATQISQGVCFQYGLESMRRRKPKMSGVAICHFITNRPLMKWEIVDYYGVKKKSFDYVKMAFQPVLASLDYGKRRYNPGEVFEGDLHIINDLQRGFEDVTCTITMKDQNGAVIKTESYQFNIDENIAAIKAHFAGDVVGTLGGTFSVDISLLDGDTVLCENHYDLLVMDQEKARIAAKERYQIHRDATVKFGKTFYRDFPEIYHLD
ncbi:MAG: glycoside hydrolase family 2 TIM barrel-domain containing protein [Lachnospiraceae bacterium]